MLKRILGIVGWLGTALVLAAVAVRFLRPEWDAYAYWLAWAGLVCILLYTLGQWREIARLLRAAAGAARHDLRRRASSSCSGILVAINYLASRENKRWDLTAAGQFTLSDQTRKVLQGLDAPLKVLVFEQESTDVPAVPRSAGRVRVRRRRRSASSTSTRTRSRRSREQYQIQQYGTVVLEYKGRTERVVGRHRAGADQRHHQGRDGPASARSTSSQGHGEKDTASTERAGYSGIATALGARQLQGREASCSRSRRRCRPTRRSSSSPGRRPTSCRPRSTRCARYLAKGGKCLLLIDPPEKADSPPLPNLVALAQRLGRSRSATTSSST